MSGTLQYPFGDTQPDYRHTQLMAEASQRLSGRPPLLARVRGLVVPPRRRPATPPPAAFSGTACPAGKC
jgi:hypothetical protein